MKANRNFPIKYKEFTNGSRGDTEPIDVNHIVNALELRNINIYSSGSLFSKGLDIYLKDKKDRDLIIELYNSEDYSNFIIALELIYQLLLNEKL